MSTHYDTRSSLGWTISYIYYVVLDKTVRIFAYSSTREQSKAENRERDWGETLKIRFFSLASHACEARAVRAHKTLTPRVTDFFTDFEEKTGCFAVYS